MFSVRLMFLRLFGILRPTGWTGFVYVDDGQNHEFKQGKFIYDKLSFSSQELISEPGQRLHAVGPAGGAEAQKEREKRQHEIH